jgi:hypothetical protein
MNIPSTDDEILLEDPIGRDTTDPSTSSSPRLDAMDVNVLLTNSTNPEPDSTNMFTLSETHEDLGLEDYGLTADGQHWRDLVEPDNSDHVFSSLNWLWPFEELGDEIMHLPNASGSF